MAMSHDTHHEGGVVPQGQEPQTQAVEDVDHACHPGVLPKCHHPLPALVHHPLVVNQPDILKGKRPNALV